MAALDFANRLRAWSYRRQGLDGSLGDPMRALERVIGVYSTNPSGALSLLARVPDLTPEQAMDLDKEGAAVRFPNMHGSTHLVPADLAGVVFGATRVNPERFVPQLRGEGLDLASYQALKPELLHRLREPVEARTIKKTLGLGSAELLAVRTMARELLVLRIASSVRTDQIAYVATDAWLGQPIAAVEQDAATRQLAERYLRGFGPARVQDLAWWIPASQARVREALAGLDLVEVAPGFLLPADLEDAFWAVEAVDTAEIRILPKWDAWAMGYAPDGRERTPTTPISPSPIRQARPRPTKPLATAGPSSCEAAARSPAGSRALPGRISTLRSCRFPACASMNRRFAPVSKRSQRS